MSTTTPAPIPAVPTPPARQDDGYFGPDSVSWRIFSDPSSKLGGVAALLLQALNPHMMRLFSKVTRISDDPEGRMERTDRYVNTTIFGDRAHADAAAASVRRMHAHATWTDPRTGETIRSDTPEWLLWTHNTIVWGVLRAAEEFGLPLTPEEQDRFVREQHIAAHLIGISEDTPLETTRAELDAYIEEQSDWMALTLPAAEVSRTIRRPSLRGNPLKTWTGVVVQDGVLALLPDWARLLYGIEGRPMNLRAAAGTTRRMISAARRSAGYERVIAEVTTTVDAHPHRKVRTPP